MTTIDNRVIDAIKAEAEAHDVTTEFVAAMLLGRIANHFGIPAVVWSRGDMEHEVDERYPNETPERREAIVDAAITSSYWEGLGDCSDGDWDLVRLAAEQGWAETQP